MGAREILAGKAAVEVSVLDKTAAGFAAAEAKLKAFSKSVANIGRATSRLGRDITMIGAAALAPMGLALNELYDVAGKGLLNEKDFGIAVDLFASLQDLRNAFSELAVEVALAVAPALTDLAKVFAPILRAMAKFAEENGALAVAFLGVATATTAIGIAIWGLGSALATAGIAIGGIVAAVGMVGAPVLLIVAAIGAIVTALATATAAFFIFTEVGQRIAAGFAQFMQGIIDAVANGDLRSAWEQVLKGIEVQWLAHILVIKQAFWGLAQFVADVLAGMLRGVAGVLEGAEKLTGMDFGSGTIKGAAISVSGGVAGMAQESIGSTEDALAKAKEDLAIERKLQAGRREDAWAAIRAGMAAAEEITGPKDEKKERRGDSSEGTFNAFGAALLGRAGPAAPPKPDKEEEKKTNKLLEAIKKRLEEMGGGDPRFAFE
ncbi:MAG: hypothetical protein SFU86_07560 [Pirellulaceae bacterium]|nr:hypothetical protein [Pirellulaceae bacterium]